LALKTYNVIATVREMHVRSRAGGFEFQAAPGPEYYKKVAQKVVSNVWYACSVAHLLHFTCQHHGPAALGCRSV
jgi:hypothetical protein